MNEQIDYKLIERARAGNKAALSRLAEAATGRLKVYVYRLTLDDDLTQDIVQESLLEMCRILGKLRRDDKFWPWLYSIAANKLKRHHRDRKIRNKALNRCSPNKQSSHKSHGGLEKLVSDELKEIISKAMLKIRTRYRSILIMRCYDQMPYSEIAHSLGCSEFGARMLFVRARRSLQKELSKKGLGKAALITALVVFGKMTAPSNAAAAQISVTAATLETGFLATLLGVVTSKTAVVSVTAAAVLTGGVVVSNGILDKTRPANEITRSAKISVNSPFAFADKYANQYWYYFPDGVGRPVMMGLKNTAQASDSCWLLLQNSNANYLYKRGTVYINNCRFFNSDLRTIVLPTDGADMRSFIRSVEGAGERWNYIAGSGRNLLVIAEKNSAGTNGNSWGIRHRNVLDEDYFSCDWPTDTRIIDNRDPMHKRGWGYFKVTGRINNTVISGSGRLAFTYEALKKHRPWLLLRFGNGAVIADTGRYAWVRKSSQQISAVYNGGMFFLGLARPWTGLHTIDVIRRDAARRHVRFETQYDKGTGNAQISLKFTDCKLVYTVDLLADVIKRITFFKAGEVVGVLNFSYLQETTGIDSEFARPSEPRGKPARKGAPGILWLPRLTEMFK